jgi:hypothetical protein
MEAMRAKGLLVATTMSLGLGVWTGSVYAAVNIEVDLASQTMHVMSGNGQSYDWPVSTARQGFVTPRGRYGVQSLQAMHYSRKYHDSPMPHSIFFNGGYAIHGTYETGSLGAAASHGCVRLSPDHAAELYGMVRAEGASISIIGSPRRGDVQVAGRRDDTRVASSRHRRNDRSDAYARRRQMDENPLAYAPLAPTYDDWMQDPFDAL